MFITELSRMPVELQRMLLTILMLAPFLPFGLLLTRVGSGEVQFSIMHFHWALLGPCVGFAVPICFFILYSSAITMYSTIILPAAVAVMSIMRQPGANRNKGRKKKKASIGVLSRTKRDKEKDRWAAFGGGARSNTERESDDCDRASDDDDDDDDDSHNNNNNDDKEMNDFTPF